MFYCCRNLADVCLLKQGGSRYPPPPSTARAHPCKQFWPGRILENNMWYEIKQKQQKMPKARANITVYSSRRFSGSSLIFSCLTVSFSCGIVYSRVKRTPESEKRRRTYTSSNGKSKRKCWYVYVPGTYISPFVLALEGGVNSNPSRREVILEDGKSETGPKQLRTWLTRSVRPYTGDQARSVE